MRARWELVERGTGNDCCELGGAGIAWMGMEVCGWVDMERVGLSLSWR